MGRVRTPSPRRDRERRRSRSRDRERRVRHRRSHSRSPHRRRSRSKSPLRRRSRSKSPHRRRSRSPVSRKRSSTPEKDTTPGSKKSGSETGSSPGVNEEEFAGLDPDQAEMMRMMGFAGFSSTKGKKVAGNDIFAANIITKRKFRQYMNRRGGFNRPLDFIA